MATKFKNSVEIDGYLSISSGNWIQVPDGTTAQRPGSPQVGMFRYNTTTAEFEGYFGSPAAWGAIGGGGGSGTVTEAFKTFAVSGQTSIVANGPTDTLTVAAGNNISLTTDAATNTLTIASTGGSGGGTVTIQRNNYTGDGSTVAYGVSSTVVSENNIQIYLDGVYQDKDTFTATGTTVTFSTAPPATTEIEIMHYVAVDGVIEVDEFVGDGTTTAFATSLSIINENATQVYVSGVYQSKLTYQTTGNVVSFTTAPPNGANIEIVHIKALALSGFNKNNFVGTGSQTAFTLNTTVNEENMTFVFLEGIYQDKSTYGISGTTLTFATAPQNGYNVEVMVLGAISASTNALYTDTFTGDGTETNYSLGITPVDLNAIEVYLNGLYQNVGTLSLAANVVTFATPPPSGVIIEIRSVGFLNSGGTLAPATLIGGTGIEVITNSPNNFTISNTLIDTTVSYNTPTGQSLTYTTPSTSTGQAGSVYGPQTFTITSGATYILSGTASISGLPNGLTVDSQSYDNSAPGNILTITLGGVFPSANSLNTNLVISGLTSTLANFDVDFLVVAGGGAGNNDVGGGGGAGGLRTSYGSTTGGGGSAESSLTLATATNYTITVGAGGTYTYAGTTNNPGNNSIFSTITSTGGGGGAFADVNGGNGGSGGGGGRRTGIGGSAVTSPVVQGYAGGNGTYYSGDGSGAGGGGAGGAGNGNSSNIVGGNSLSVSITGSSVEYAGGGGGGSGSGGTGGSGGGAGAGSGGQSGGSGSSASANTGSGGGGGANAGGGGGNGGSGIVILRYPNTKTITIPGGLTATTTTDGSDKVTTFTAGTGNISFS
jgi:hypothetical protein